MRKRAVVRRFVGASALMIAVGAVLAAVVGWAIVGWAGWAFFALVCLLVLLWAWASFTPNSPLFGKVVTGRGTNDRVLALTFDDGPSSEWTPRVLDALRRTGRARRSSCSDATPRSTPSSSGASARKATRSRPTATTTRC